MYTFGRDQPILSREYRWGSCVLGSKTICWMYWVPFSNLNSEASILILLTMALQSARAILLKAGRLTDEADGDAANFVINIVNVGD